MRECKQCLVRDLADKDQYASMYTYISQMDEELKVTTELYERRLERCQSCEGLLSGMCRHCGCFVEMRAVMKKNSCPYDYW